METVSDARNRERRNRYADDPDYREKAVQATRDRYRRNVGLKFRRGAKGFDLRRIGRWCERRDVRVGNHVHLARLVMKVRELALIVGRKPDVVRRWIDQDMLPPPIGMVRHDREGHGMVPVYFLEEAREIVHVMRDHQDETPYFRSDHDVTINDLHVALIGVRRSL